MMQTRKHSLVVRVSSTELAKIHALANAEDREIARVVRSWIDAKYTERFGDAMPPEPTLKHRKGTPPAEGICSDGTT